MNRKLAKLLECVKRDGILIWFDWPLNARIQSFEEESTKTDFFVFIFWWPYSIVSVCLFEFINDFFSS